MPGEFDIIARYFRPLSGPESLDLRDDCAIISCPQDEELAISTDTMVENVHFLPTDPPETLGRKLLRCNLSDLAAMGAAPYAYTLNLTLPKNRPGFEEDWIKAFTSGLAEDQNHFGLTLLGGDTTSTTGPLVLSVTIFGRIKKGQSLRRSTARPGDTLYVTGTIGDAALGLLALQNTLPDPTGFLSRRYRIPTPRTGLPVFGTVHAAMDVSDGLIQDCGHLAHESDVQITILADTVPVSDAAEALGPDWQIQRLTGGDDYELLLTCPPENNSRLEQICKDHGTPVTRIGYVTEGQGVQVFDSAGNTLSFSKKGWQHF